MRERIICRFNDQKDLDDFNKLNNWNLAKNFKEFNVHTQEYSIKKEGVPKEIIESWKKEWFGMPEYVSEKQQVFAKIEFIFDKNDIIELPKRIFNQSFSEKTTSVWFPKLVSGKHADLRVVGGTSITRYPIYIVSKGRSQKCSTSIFLSQMEVPHFVVVEPSDLKQYKENVENEYATIIELDMRYKDDYDTFDNLGNSKGSGPGGARNFCWDDSIKKGFKWHWVFDDNAVEGFHYMWRNQKVKCRTGAIFQACEDFVDRYENIAQAGLNYSMFCKMTDKTPAFVINTRIYSFLLIRNDISYRWRGRYNEDTDLSLRVLKDGWCTIQFNAFLAGKATTQKIEGGNTEMFYSKEGTLPKSKMLEDMHPDVAKVVWKFNRWHHEVDYSGFKQQLKLKSDISRDCLINNYGMVIFRTKENNTCDSKSYLENKYDFEIKNKMLNSTQILICDGECEKNLGMDYINMIKSPNCTILCEPNSIWHKIALEKNINIDFLTVDNQLNPLLQNEYDAILTTKESQNKIKLYKKNIQQIITYDFKTNPYKSFKKIYK